MLLDKVLSVDQENKEHKAFFWVTRSIQMIPHVGNMLCEGTEHKWQLLLSVN